MQILYWLKIEQTCSPLTPGKPGGPGGPGGPYNARVYNFIRNKR